MISGMYMGEVARLVLAQMTREGLIFDGMGPELLFEPGQFFTKYVSEIETYDHISTCHIALLNLVLIKKCNMIRVLSFSAIRRENILAAARCLKNWAMKTLLMKTAPTFAMSVRSFLAVLRTLLLPELLPSSTRWVFRMWQWPLTGLSTDFTLISMIWWSTKSDNLPVPS